MSKEIKDGGPAFPESVAVGPTNDVYSSREGMSLLDYFAARAMQGLLVNQGDDSCSLEYHEDIADQYAEAAYKLARAMLKARKADGK